MTAPPGIRACKVAPEYGLGTGAAMTRRQIDSQSGEPREPDTNDPAPPSEPDVRFSYANERTFLAWVRTSLGFVTAGLAITQLLPPFDFSSGRRLIGLPLIAVGVVIAVFSFWNWRNNEAAMREFRPLPKSPIPLVSAIAVSAVATMAFVIVIVAG